MQTSWTCSLHAYYRNKAFILTCSNGLSNVKIGSYCLFFPTLSKERRAKEELQETMADQARRAMRVWLVQWELEDWKENQAFLDHQAPEVCL